MLTAYRLDGEAKAQKAPHRIPSPKSEHHDLNLLSLAGKHPRTCLYLGSRPT